MSETPYTLHQAIRSCGVKPHPEFLNIPLIKHKPRESQLSIIKSSLLNNKWGDFSEAGTGKSLSSYIYISALMLKGLKVMCVMPPGLTDQYLEAYKENIDMTSTGKSMAVLAGTPTQRAKLFSTWDKEGWPDLLVLGYQMFLKEGKTTLKQKGYSVFVADEAHALKTPSSKTYKLMKKYITEKETNRFLAMTGTPSPTTPECAYGLISLVSPEAYKNKAQFDRRHLVKARMGNIAMVTVGYKKLKRLSSNLYLRASRVLKEEVLSVEKPNIIPVDIEMSPSHRKLYKDLLDERLLVFGDEIIPAIQAQTLRRYAMQICSDPNSYTDSTITNTTLPRLDTLLDSLGVVKFSKAQIAGGTKQLTKAVVFCHYSSTIKMLTEHLKHLNPAVIDGAHNTKANKDKFITDESCRVVIIQPQSGGEGLDGFQHVSHNILVFEPMTSPGVFDQCCSRLIRSGQKKAVNVYIFNIKNTVFDRAIKVMLGRVKDMRVVVRSVGDLTKELLTVL